MSTVTQEWLLKKLIKARIKLHEAKDSIQANCDTIEGLGAKAFHFERAYNELMRQKHNDTAEVEALKERIKQMAPEKQFRVNVRDDIGTRRAEILAVAHIGGVTTITIK